MKPEPVKEFFAGDHVVVFRYPCFRDWRGIMKKTSSLTKEKSFGAPQELLPEKYHRKQMRDRLNAIKEHVVVYLVVEIGGQVIGAASIWKTPDKPEEGWLEISIRSTLPGTDDQLHGIGIGGNLVYAILHQAKTVLEIKIVKLGVYAVNHGAVHLYKKCGFVETARKRREKNHYGVMRDRIYMQKSL